MNKDVINLIKDSASTALNIVLMAQYQVKYLQEGDKEAKEKMYKHAFFAGVGIVSLFTIGISNLIESRKDNNRAINGSWYV